MRIVENTEYNNIDLFADDGMDLIPNTEELEKPTEQQQRAKRVTIPVGTPYWVEVVEIQ